MEPESLEYSFGNNKMIIDGHNCLVTVISQGIKNEYAFSSIYGLKMMKSKTYVRFIYFTVVFGFIGIGLSINGILQLPAGIGESSAGVFFVLLSIFCFWYGVLPRYSVNIMNSSGDLVEIKAKRTEELEAFIRQANRVISLKVSSQR